MSVRRHLGFGSTPNWRNFYKQVEANTIYELQCKLGRKVDIMDWVKMPITTMTGSEKLHGENMAVCYSQGEIWIQGRNHIRTLLGDQNGMAQFVESTRPQWVSIFNQIEDLGVNSVTNTIILDCEWAGGNIQKGNAACSGTDKGAYIFDYFRVVNNDTDESQYKSTTGLEVYPDDSIYLMKSFGSYELVLDLNKPEECEQQLTELAEKIEKNSPIADYFDKPENVGEGVYLTCMYEGKLFRLKAKGLKHGGKPKTPREPKVPITDAEQAAITKLADAVTPVWRLTQGITESGATEMKHIGEVIKWIMADIAKEEQPVIIESGIEFKKAQSAIVKIIKDYYIDSIKGY